MWWEDFVWKSIPVFYTIWPRWSIEHSRSFAENVSSIKLITLWATRLGIRRVRLIYASWENPHDCSHNHYHPAMESSSSSLRFLIIDPTRVLSKKWSSSKASILCRLSVTVLLSSIFPHDSTTITISSTRITYIIETQQLINESHIGHRLITSMERIQLACTAVDCSSAYILSIFNQRFLTGWAISWEHWRLLRW